MTSYVRAAKKRWPKAIWISGTGRYASVALCPPGTTIELHGARTDAEIAKAVIDDTACGGRCRGSAGHSIVDMETGTTLTPWPLEDVHAALRARTGGGDVQ